MVDEPQRGLRIGAFLDPERSVVCILRPERLNALVAGARSARPPDLNIELALWECRANMVNSWLFFPTSDHNQAFASLSKLLADSSR